MRLYRASFFAVGWPHGSTTTGPHHDCPTRIITAQLLPFLWPKPDSDVPDLGWLRAPQPPRAVPKPVSIDDARLLQAIFNCAGLIGQKARFCRFDAVIWCWLAHFEALGLFRKDAPLGEWLSITGKGGKMRDVPVLKAASEAVDDYLGACPFDGGLMQHCFLVAVVNRLGRGPFNDCSKDCVLNLICQPM